MKKRNFAARSHIASSFLLLFCITFSLAFYNCLAKEYDYNLQIDRGFVNGGATYFSLVTDTDPETEVLGSASNEEDTSLQKTICFSENDSYLLASQLGTTRAVYYQGDITMPPIVSGRFLTSTECLSDQRRAVIGHEYVDKTWLDPITQKTMISVEEGDYEVIGIMGMAKVSTIDNLIFVNIGSIDTAKILSSILYLDSNTGNTVNLFRIFSEKVASETRFSTNAIDMPATATDVVSGGVFMASFLKGIIYSFLVITFLCTLVFFVLSNKSKISIYMLVGQTYRQILRRVSTPILISGFTGLVFADICFGVIENTGFFALTSVQINTILLYSTLAGVVILILFPVFQYFSICSMNLQESLR